MIGITAGLFAGAEAVHSQTTETVDKEFDLNITADRITEINFERATMVRLSAEDVLLQVGASASADRIDVILKGITGHVRFRASLERTRQVLSARPQPKTKE